MSVASEVRAIEEAHRAAQARLGIAGAYLALREWGGVSPISPVETSRAWLARSLRMIMAIRGMSRSLAIAYYQLARALETGRTLGIPEASDNPDEVTMGLLRQQYLDLLLDIASLEEPSDQSSATADGAQRASERWFKEELGQSEIEGADSNSRAPRLSDIELDSYIQDLLDETGTNDGEAVEVDEFDWPENWDEPRIEDAFRDTLQKKAVDSQQDKSNKIRKRDDINPDRAVSQIEKEHANSGSSGAGWVDKAGISSGREVVDHAQSRDTLVKMVARGTAPNPCAFCAMLASRGFVYKGRVSSSGQYQGGSALTTRSSTTRAGTEVGSTIRSYHPNCHCYPIVRWTSSSALPELNQFYQDMWPKVTSERGYFGNDALNAWRRWITGGMKPLE